MFNNPNEGVNIAQLRHILGQAQKVEIFPQVRDAHGEKAPEVLRTALSGSILKQYLDDPVSTFYSRGLKVTPQKEYTPTQLKNFRFGKATHALILEGEEVFKQNFPVFGGKKRAGSEWDKFLAENKDTDLEQILSVDEEAKVTKMGDFVRKQLNSFLKSSPPHKNIRNEWYEIAIVVHYSSGLVLQVICDALWLKWWEEMQRWTLEIVDLKTITKSPFNPVNLAFAIDDGGYDLSAALYVTVVEDALMLQPDYFLPNPTVPPVTVEFSLFWANKESFLTAWQGCIVHSDPSVQEGDWAFMGRTKLAVALQKYFAVYNQWEQSFQTQLVEEEARNIVPGYIHAPPIKKHEWTLKDLLAGFDPNWQGANFPHKYRPNQLWKEKFGTPLYPEPETPKQDFGFEIPSPDAKASPPDITSKESLEEIKEAADNQEAIEPLHGLKTEVLNLQKTVRKKERFEDVVVKELRSRGFDLKIDWSSMDIKEIKETVKKKHPTDLFVTFQPKGV